MKHFSRREIHKLIMGGVCFPAVAQTKPKYSIISGIQFGVQSFSFHDLPHGEPQIAVPKLVQYMKAVGASEIQPLALQIEPLAMTGYYYDQAAAVPHRSALRQWRLTVPMSYYANIRKQFEGAQVSIYAYDISLRDCTEEELDRIFEASKALGAKAIGTSVMLSEARRLIPFAEKHDVMLLLHNHDLVCNPDQLASPESLEAGLAMSKQFRVCLDLGHYAAGNNDPVAFIEKHAARIPLVHIRDRVKNNGPYVPLGEGDAKIKEVLRLIKDKQYPIRCYIEYEHGSLRTPVEEVLNCLEYCRKALA